MKTKPNNDDELKLSIRQNALDSFEHALHHYNGESVSDFKYVVLHFSHAIELFLKARLEREHYSLIYVKPEDAKKKDGHTINLGTAIARLRVNNVRMSEQEIKDLHFIKNVRNSIEHHIVELKKSEVQVYVGRAFRFLHQFLEEELKINLLDEFPKELFKDALESLISYEERVAVAKREMDSCRSDPRDGNEQDVKFCDDCGEETILFPDPTTKDNSIHCFNCEKKFQMERCARCGLSFVVQSKDEALCAGCFLDLIEEE